MDRDLSVNGDFLCMSCRMDGENFDYLRGITRLTNASRRGVKALREAAEIESLLLGGDIFYRHSPRDTISVHESDIDSVSRSLLQNFTSESGDPLKTTGDGDCLFNAASLVLVGNETKSVELRYKTALMLINAESEIRSHQDKVCLKDLSPDYDTVLRDCAKIGKFSSQWTIIALAKVLDMPVRVIYPAVGGKKGLAYKVLNCTYNSSTSGEPLRIMWTSVKEPSAAMISGKKWWIPNHFVPVVTARESFVSPQSSHDHMSKSSVMNVALPASSTPNDSDWEQPKIKTTARGLRTVKINLSNRFDCLSSSDDSVPSGIITDIQAPPSKKKRLSRQLSVSPIKKPTENSEPEKQIEPDSTRDFEHFASNQENNEIGENMKADYTDDTENSENKQHSWAGSAHDTENLHIGRNSKMGGQIEPDSPQDKENSMENGSSDTEGQSENSFSTDIASDRPGHVPVVGPSEENYLAVNSLLQVSG